MKRIAAALVFALVGAGISCGAVQFKEDFESLAPGPLQGQPAGETPANQYSVINATPNSTAAAQAEVQTAVVHSGKQALLTDGKCRTIIRRRVDGSVKPVDRLLNSDIIYVDMWVRPTLKSPAQFAVLCGLVERDGGKLFVRTDLNVKNKGVTALSLPADETMGTGAVEAETGATLKKNEWNRLTLEINYKTGFYSVYINGAKTPVGEFKFAAPAKKGNLMYLNIEGPSWAGVSGEGSQVYYDDIIITDVNPLSKGGQG